MTSSPSQSRTADNNFADPIGADAPLDREALERLANLALPPQPRWIIASSFANGTRMYCPYEPGKSGHFMVRPDWQKGLVPLSFCAPITTRYWDDDGSAEFTQMYARLERQAMVLEPAGPTAAAG